MSQDFWKNPQLTPCKSVKILQSTPIIYLLIYQTTSYMESKSRQTDHHFWNRCTSGVNHLHPFRYTMQIDFAATVQAYSSHCWRYMYKTRYFIKMLSIFWFRCYSWTMLISPWECVPHKELRKSHTPWYKDLFRSFRCCGWSKGIGFWYPACGLVSQYQRN